MIKERILIVGSGSIAKRHFEIARSFKRNAEIKFLSLHGASEIQSSLLISDKKSAIDFQPNIAIIANASSSHVEVSNLLLNDGINLLIEKPISNNLMGVYELIEKSECKKSVLMVGYNLRFLDSLIFFKKMLDEGIVGKPLIVKSEIGHFLPNWRKEIDYKNSVSAQKKLGGGVLLELSHAIDYLDWLFGSIEWVRATLSQQSSLAIDVEDSAVLTFGINNPKNNNLVATLHMDFIRHDPQRSCLVIGESGSLKWDGMKQEVSIYEAGTSLWRVIFSSGNSLADSYIEEWRDFLDSIESGKSPRVSGKDGLKVLEVITASIASASNGNQTPIKRSFSMESH